jgi:hypothetical protein
MVSCYIDEWAKFYTVNNRELEELIEALQPAAERLDCALDVDLPPPASTEAIAAVAADVGGPISESLTSFLKLHNGMKLTLKPKTSATEAAILFPLLYIYGTDMIVYFKKSLKVMLDSVSDAFPDSMTEEKAYRCVPIASISQYNDQEQILFVRDAPRAHGEYAIVEADLGNSPLWLLALGDDVETITIADVFDDFVRGAIGNVIAGNDGFRYWTSDALWAKY